LVAVQQRMLQEVSHELRSPLTRLQTAIALAQQNPHNFLATLDRIESESLRLQSMLENMLTLAHVEMGAKQILKGDVDLIELLSGITRDAHFEAQARGSELTFLSDDHCVAQVHAELLYRAFENIIRNAVKYTRPGTCVEVTAKCIDAQLLITVADRGPGVDVADLLKIFEPFYRVAEQQREIQASPSRAAPSSFTAGLSPQKIAPLAVLASISYYRSKSIRTDAKAKNFSYKK